MAVQMTHEPDVDICHYRLFMKARKVALALHFIRANFQAKIWMQADNPTFNMEMLVESGVGTNLIQKD